MASVGFVYVGLKPPSPELGLMIVELFPYYHEAPWLLAQPISTLFVLVLGFHLLSAKSDKTPRLNKFIFDSSRLSKSDALERKL